MKNQIPSKETKFFKIKHTKKTIILSIAVLVLCIFGIGLTLYRCFHFGIHGFTDVLKYPFLIAIELLCIFLVITVLAKSQYLIDEKLLTVQYGVIKTKIEIKSITSILLDTDTKKMTLYMGEEYFVLSLPEADNHEFVQAIRKNNSDIEYSFTLSDQ